MHRFVSFALLLASVCVPVAAHSQAPRVLVFSKTAGFRHSSIETASPRSGSSERRTASPSTRPKTPRRSTTKNLEQVSRRRLPEHHRRRARRRAAGRTSSATSRRAADGSAFTPPPTPSTTGRGTASLAGAWFKSHPLQSRTSARRRSACSTRTTPPRRVSRHVEREDEFYNFKSINPDIHVLIDIDEKSYQGGDERRPPSDELVPRVRRWTRVVHEHGPHRSDLLRAALPRAPARRTSSTRWAPKPLDYTRARPEENRFTKVVLAEGLDEPVELAVLPGDRVLFIERHGHVNLYTPATKRTKRIATIPVSTEVREQRVRRRTDCSASPPIRTSRRTAGSTCTTRPPAPSRRTCSRAST